MAFNTAPGRAEYTASAGQTIFTFVFKIFETADIKVYLTPAGNDPDDTADLLTETTDYTVAINGDNGGDMTLVVAASVGDKVTIVRDLEVKRDTEFQSLGDLTAANLNDDQDRQTYLVGDGGLNISRAFRIPDTAQGFDPVISTLVADGYFKVNATGDGVEADTTLPDAVVTSSDYVLDAESWANEAEDTPVQVHTSGVGADRVPTVYSAKHWAIKAQDAVIGDVEFRDTEWRVFDDLDNTKKIAFQASGISTATTRTITMPDADVDLGEVGQTDFADDVFRVSDNADSTKKVAFELSGVTTATTRTLTVPDKDGTLATLADVGAGSLTTNDFFHAQDQKASGTHGGASSAGTQTRTLNTVVTNTIAGASLATNQVTLPAGTYYIEAVAPAFASGSHRAYIHNVTDAATDILGRAAYQLVASDVMTDASLVGLVTYAASKTIELRHYIGSADAVGLGVRTNDGNTEIYSEIKIWKVG